GACLAAAHLSDTVIRGVIQLPTGAWFEVGEDEQGNRIEIHGNPNVLTPDRGTSELSQGCSAQSTLVDMCLYHGPLTELTVHTPPSFVHN
ncbi:molybdopterin dinucleotide binding domain-containing protein, partial [Gluconobacter kondonii]|uniref:molybdopterin dinucleotide binding domain-containing protein n=1 Tax=Gluconobacter kondonii TaxID=941463 RepID=UPI00272B5B23